VGSLAPDAASGRNSYLPETTETRGLQIELGKAGTKWIAEEMLVEWAGNPPRRTTTTSELLNFTPAK
jgi:hypothetical protein